MKCINCENEASGKSRYCGNSCRAKWSKRTKAQPQAQLNKAQPISATGLDHYKSNPDLYVNRAEPDSLNWDDWMTAAELAANKLKSNRVAIPGDWDYKGVCEQVDGQWQVQEQEPPLDITKLTDGELYRTLKYKPGISWVNSPEHTEVLNRMVEA